MPSLFVFLIDVFKTTEVSCFSAFKVGTKSLYIGVPNFSELNAYIPPIGSITTFHVDPVQSA